MAKDKAGIKWNKVHIATMSKEDFIKVHKDLDHLKGVDLAKVWQESQTK